MDIALDLIQLALSAITVVLLYKLVKKEDSSEE